MLENMIMMGEESGTLDNMLSRAAEFYEDEVDRATQGLTSMMEPMIIIVLGSIIAFIVISIMLPMFDMNSLVA
jgi:type IV pilus assembly protein PilC